LENKLEMAQKENFSSSMYDDRMRDEIRELRAHKKAWQDEREDLLLELKQERNKVMEVKSQAYNFSQFEQANDKKMLDLQD
jgi:hypothetical protein